MPPLSLYRSELSLFFLRYSLAQTRKRKNSQSKFGNNYYWINAFEETVGTDIFQNPDVMQFRELVRIN